MTDIGTEITAGFLCDWALPQPHAEDDKEARGRVLVVGGSPGMPGAVILAATAALRAGAGKVRVATAKSVAPLVASALWEGRVFALEETSSGGIAAAAADIIIEQARDADAVVIGPGMIDEESLAELFSNLLGKLGGAALLLDATALTVLNQVSGASTRLGENVLLTPHVGEMAALLECEEREVRRNPAGAARRAAEKFGAVVALKGAETFIALPGGGIFRHAAGDVGLATGGSGDVLAGLAGGLMARGATPAQAAAWAVFIHARAGKRLAERLGPLGFLARELSQEFPALLTDFDCG